MIGSQQALNRHFRFGFRRLPHPTPARLLLWEVTRLRAAGFAHLGELVPLAGLPRPRAMAGPLHFEGIQGIGSQNPNWPDHVSGWGHRGDDGVIAVGSGGEPIGAAWLRLWSELDHGYGFINPLTPELSVAVRSEARRGGIGTQLLRRLLQRADESHEEVSLSVSVQNPAVRLYERLGFRSVAVDGASMTMARTRPARNCCALRPVPVRPRPSVGRQRATWIQHAPPCKGVGARRVGQSHLIRAVGVHREELLTLTWHGSDEHDLLPIG